MFHLLVLATLALIFIYSWKNRKPANFPPGPPCLPVVGSAPFTTGNNMQFTMEKWRDQYGPLVGLMMGPRPAVAVVEARAVLEVLRHEDLQGRSSLIGFRDPSVGETLGVFFSDGPYWVEQRRFTVRHLRDFGFGKKSMEGLILEEAEFLVDELRQGSPKTIQVSKLFIVSVINVMWSVMGGFRYQRDDKDFKSLLNKLEVQFRNGDPNGTSYSAIFPSLRYLFPSWWKNLRNQERIQDFVRNSIGEHEKTFDANVMRDFIDVYLSEIYHGKPGSTFNKKSLVAVCQDLLSAGGTSVSNTLAFALLYLVIYPDMQTRIHEELDKHVGKSRRVSLDDRHNLVYLDACLLEIMRINSIAPFTAPHRATCDTTLRGYDIPKDTLIFISLWSCLQDVPHWRDPQEFRPERHIDASGKLIKDQYMADFSAGKRACPGEPLARNILFLFFATIMQELTITLPTGHDLPSTYPMSGFTASPKPFQVVITERI